MLSKLEYVRISVTDKCDLGCKYCKIIPYNKLPISEILSFEDIVYFSKACAKLGVKTIRLTGGEPLLRDKIEVLIEMLLGIDGINEITFTTNGTQLHKLAQKIFNLGVRRFNISIDTLNEEKYFKLTGGNLKNVINNLLLALDIGYSNIKVNVVALKGINDDEIYDLIMFAKKYNLILRFIELMQINSMSNEYFNNHFISIDEIKKIILKKFELIPLFNNQINGLGPAKYFKCSDTIIGFISPITEHFCSMCNKLRLTANGILKSCLLTKSEVDIKYLIKNKNDINFNLLIEKINQVFKNKNKACGHFDLENNTFENMAQIGG